MKSELTIFTSIWCISQPTMKSALAIADFVLVFHAVLMLDSEMLQMEVRIVCFHVVFMLDSKMVQIEEK